MSDPRSDLLRSRTDLLEVLDQKLKTVPEWRAFRAVDRAIAAMDTAAPAAPMLTNHGEDGSLGPLGNSYPDLGLQAIQSYGRPVPTPQMVQYIRDRRELPDDADRAKVNISSALSHDERLKNVPWQGGRAWWYADRQVPNQESAGH